MASPSTREAQESAGEPTPAGFNHLSIPVKDVQQSVRFFTEVLGAEWVMGQEGFAEVRCGGMIIGLSRQPGGWTAPDGEFPHYGFLIDADDRKVTPEMIQDAIESLIGGAGVDQLIVYFAGHGVNIRRSERWLLSDAPARTMSTSTTAA